MTEFKEFTGGVIGTTLGVVGTTTQTNETLQTISLIITIVGALISMVILPLINWYRNAKKDGKITSDEIDEAIEITQKGVENIKDDIERKK